VNKDLVFIASGGRTGTSFLGHELCRVIDDCWSEHEPDILHATCNLTRKQVADFGLWHMVVGRLLGRTGVRVLGQRLLTGQIDPATVRRRIRQSRRRYHERISETLVIESHAQWWYLAAELQSIFPGAKLIGVVRDPRSWVRSWLNHGGRYDRSDRVRWLPPGRLTPARLGQTELARLWKDWGAFERLAWEWRVIYGHLARATEGAKNARMFRFEDLFAGDGAAMADLVLFAASHGQRRYSVRSLEGFTARVHNSSHGSAVQWEAWTPEQARFVQHLCGPLMERWGYGMEPEWKDLAARG